MGYEGFDQQLCDHGHYNETNYIDLHMPFKCIVVQCEGEVAWYNPVDDTNHDLDGYIDMSTFECRSSTLMLPLRLCFSWAGTELIPVKTYDKYRITGRFKPLADFEPDRDAEVHAELDRLINEQADTAVLGEALERIDTLQAALTEMLTLRFEWPKWKSISLDPFVECPGCYSRQALDHSGDFEWEPVGPIEHARSCPSHLLTCKKHG
jgi:hypothetical protein